MKLSISAAVIFSSPMVSTTRCPAADPAVLGGEACCPQAANSRPPQSASAVAINGKKANERLFKIPSQLQKREESLTRRAQRRTHGERRAAPSCLLALPLRDVRVEALKPPVDRRLWALCVRGSWSRAPLSAGVALFLNWARVSEEAPSSEPPKTLR
jgi:hypothetical protein